MARRKTIGSIVFDLLNKETVDRLQRAGTVVLPRRKVDIPKDKRWNKKFINSQLIQGLEEGESPLQIAKRILPEITKKSNKGRTESEKKSIVKMNKQSAIRNARTMTTSAENHGRLDSYKQMVSEGIVMKKQWMATPDDRTRPSHIDMDGEEQEINAMFSNGCEFPGDGKGPAEEVWNCRCSMHAYVLGFRRQDGSISYVDHGQDRTLHDEQMEEEKERRKQSGKQNNRHKNR